MNKIYTGNYMGIVIQNNDPEKRGRAKIWVPHISAVVYDKWNKITEDKNFVFPDLKTNPDLTNIMDDLKAILPWAECASPMFGGNASGRYNSATKEGTTSDSNYWENNEHVDGNRPLQNFIGDNIYPDAFTDTSKNKNRFVNKYANQYTPSNYSNLARGLFTIPNVGAHVWVFFVEGNINMPVYFASSYGQEDWKRIYDMTQDKEDISNFNSTDYPESYENIGSAEKRSIDSDTKTFRSKTVLNSNKHTIELVDTDNREILKMTHYSGSFKEFNNYANIELASNNDQKMVVGDQFLTVNKNQSVYVAQTQEIIVGGDQYITVGSSTKVEDVKKIKDILTNIHEYKKLFDVKRAQEGEAPNDVSKYQRRVGTKGACPICGNKPYKPNYGAWSMPPKIIMTLTEMLGPVVSLSQTLLPFTVEFTTAEEMIASGELDIGDFASLTGSTGIYGGSKCDVCNGYGIKKPEPGFSPSTQYGNWNIEDQKTTKLKQLLISTSEELFGLERKLGEGDQIIDISKNKIENIGLVMNDLKSFRVDPIGKLRIDGMHVSMEETYVTFRPSSHVEYVAVDDVPGGDYNLTVSNKYKLLVGAKGVNIKTFGPIDIYGTIINMTGEQVNISSNNEVLIDGGERFSIRARKVALIPFEHNPVAVEGQLHVTRNMIVGGGSMLEGEVGLLHITAPMEYQQTLMSGTDETFQMVQTTTSVGAVTPHYHYILPHMHIFKNIPLTLLPTQQAVRDVMVGAGINSTTSLAAAAPVHNVFSGVDSETLNKYLIPAGNKYIDKLGIAGPNKAYGFVRAFVVKTTNEEGVISNTVSMIYNYDVNGIKGQHMKEGLILSVTYSKGTEGNVEIGEITHTIKEGNLVNK